METLCHRGGHTKASTGASDRHGLNELTEDRKIDKRVAELLSPYYNMVNCTPPESYTYPQELSYGINLSNKTKPKMFYSIHLNSAIGAKGSEICVYPNTKLTIDVGNKILNNLKALGFVNRGIKPRTDLGETCDVNAPSMIIEVCFVQQPDADLYKKLGVEKIARAIANGIDNRVDLTTLKPVEQKPQVEMHRNIVIYNNGAEADKSCAEYFAMILNSKGEDCIVIDYQEYRKSLVDGKSIFAVGGSLEGKFKYDKLFSGKDRNETAQQVLNHLKVKY